MRNNAQTKMSEASTYVENGKNSCDWPAISIDKAKKISPNKGKLFNRKACSTHRERIRNLYQSNISNTSQRAPLPLVKIDDPRAYPKEEIQDASITARITEDQQNAIDYGAQILMN